MKKNVLRTICATLLVTAGFLAGYFISNHSSNVVSITSEDVQQSNSYTETTAISSEESFVDDNNPSEALQAEMSEINIDQLMENPSIQQL